MIFLSPALYTRAQQRAAEDNTMSTLISPDVPAVDEDYAAVSRLRGPITALMLRWGIGLGTIVGTALGFSIGWTLRNAVPGGGFDLPIFGLMTGAVAGFLFGLFIAFVDALLLVRAVPDVLAGRSEASRAAATSAAVGVLVVFGLVVLLLMIVWNGVLGEFWITGPAIALAFIAWVAGNLVGQRALRSTLDTLS